jgi:2-polyprenyl-3-methyl-5-hydroxy-6-metoxy-1,4-benzoquinol methylase
VAVAHESEEETEDPGGALQLRSLDELEAKLAEAEVAWKVSDDAMREVFKSFVYLPPPDAPSDPYSAEYQEYQFALYRMISERTHYEIENERCDFRVDANRPFPYYTESADTVGHQLMAMGFIITTMGLPSGSSILELGPGWGNTTIELARMGYDVTAIDIDPTFIDLIKERADKFALTVDARKSTFLEIDTLGRRYDAVLFFECFHHCSDHRELVRKLADVITPDGRVYFAAEPILEQFPVPWGVRTDGESLWAIRRNGWLELGFQESYFVRMLAHLGWQVVKHTTSATHLGVIFEARRANGTYELGSFELPPDEAVTWVGADTPGVGPSYTSGRSVLSIEQGRSSTAIVVDGTSNCPVEREFRLTHGDRTVSGVVPPSQPFTIEVPYDPCGSSLVIEVDPWRPSDLLGSIDNRELGLLVDRVSFRP